MRSALSGVSFDPITLSFGAKNTMLEKFQYYCQMICYTHKRFNSIISFYKSLFFCFVSFDFFLLNAKILLDLSTISEMLLQIES